MNAPTPYDGRPARAVLRAGQVETHYSRAGSGPSVLLLVARHPEVEESPLFATLATTFKVIAPHPPARVQAAARGGVGAWLRDVIDGLGLHRPALVAEQGFAEAALEFAGTDPERLGRIVVCRARPGAAAEPGLERHRLPTGHPLLVLWTDERRDWISAPGVARDVILFLTG